VGIVDGIHNIFHSSNESFYIFIFFHSKRLKISSKHLDYDNFHLYRSFVGLLKGFPSIMRLSLQEEHLVAEVFTEPP
jgi:hypothetical protein